MPEQDGHRQRLGLLVINCLFENGARLSTDQRYQEMCVWNLLDDEFGRGDEQRAHLADFALPAAGQQGDYGLLR